MQTFRIPLEFSTGYTTAVLEEVHDGEGAETARNNAVRKFKAMGWTPGREYTLGTPVEVEVTPLFDPKRVPA